MPSAPTKPALAVLLLAAALVKAFNQATSLRTFKHATALALSVTCKSPGNHLQACKIPGVYLIHSTALGCDVFLKMKRVPSTQHLSTEYSQNLLHTKASSRQPIHAPEPMQPPKGQPKLMCSAAHPHITQRLHTVRSACTLQATRAHDACTLYNSEPCAAPCSSAWSTSGRNPPRPFWASPCLLAIRLR